MKRVLPILLISLLLASCASVTKNMQRGDYDRVIFKTTKRLIRKPKAKDAAAMDRAYKLANERDLERIAFLEREDNPDYYDELFARYAALKERQSKIRTVTPLTVEGKTYNYEYIDYDAKIVESKNKAAEEFYRQGKSLIENAHSKEDFRQAHAMLLRADEYGGHKFSDIDELIHEAHMNGISRIIVFAENMDPQIGVTRMDLDYLISFDAQRLEGNPWTEYHFKHLGGDIVYDYEIFVKVLSIQVSDDVEKESKQDYKRKSTTEFDYALDANGNVMKDTSGNDIKIYKDVTATMIKRERSKNCIIRGEVEIMSITDEPKGSVAKIPYTGENNFQNISYQLIGNPEAVSETQRNLTKREALPFPKDTEMVKLCVEDAKPKVRDIILNSSGSYVR